MTRKTSTDAIKALADVVRNKYDFVYREDSSVQCQHYDIQNQPACIVGHVLDLWGLPENLKAHLAHETAGGAWATLENRDDVPFTFSASAREVLSAAQGVNDAQGKTWGEAYETAVAVYKALNDLGVPQDPPSES